MFGFGKKKVVKQNTIDNPEEVKEKTYIAIDIGTEFVKSVVFTLEGNEIHVIGYDRTKQGESAMSGAFIISLNDVIDTVDKSIGRSFSGAEIKFGRKFNLPKDVFLGIAGELVQGVTIMVNVDRDEPDNPITEDEIKNVVDKVKKHTFESTKDEIAGEIGIKPSQLTEINSMINSVYIDGLRTNNPVGLTGSELIYRVYSTFAPKIHLDSISQVANALNFNINQITVQPYALSLALQNIRDKNSSAIFIDIGGGTTDIAIVQNGDIMGTKMFAIGGRVFTKRLEKDLRLNYEDAEQMKLDYTDGKLSNDKELNVKKAIGKDIPIWVTGIHLALEEFEDVTEYPTEIYLCGGGALLPDIQESLLSYPWMEHFNFKKFPKISFFFPSKVRNVVDKTRSATLPMDVTPLALARMVLEN